MFSDISGTKDYFLTMIQKTLQKIDYIKQNTPIMPRHIGVNFCCKMYNQAVEATLNREPLKG